MEKVSMFIMAVCLVLQFYDVSSSAEDLDEKERRQYDMLRNKVHELISAAKSFDRRQECENRVTDCDSHTTGHWLSRCMTNYYNQNCCAWCMAAYQIVIS